MEFDSGVKSATERMDFDGVFAGASLWFRSKGQALTVEAAFKEWNKGRGLRLGTSIEKTFFDDPGGSGYRLHWLEAASNDAVDDTGFDQWADDRVVASSRRPVDGWHLISVLYADYQAWISETGRAGPPTSIVKFSQKVAAMPGVRRERVTKGSVAIGIAMKNATMSPAGSVPVDEDYHAAIARQEEEMRRMGYKI